MIPSQPEGLHREILHRPQHQADYWNSGERYKRLDDTPDNRLINLRSSAVQKSKNFQYIGMSQPSFHLITIPSSYKGLPHGSIKWTLLSAIFMPTSSHPLIMTRLSGLQLTVWQPVGNDNQGPSSIKRARLDELRFIFRIQKSSRFIQDKNRRILKHGTGDGNPLTLPPIDNQPPEPTSFKAVFKPWWCFHNSRSDGQFRWPFVRCCWISFGYFP